MPDIVVAQRMWQRRDVTANWNSVNPTLSKGEIGFEYDDATGIILIGTKIGNGVSNWAALPYYAPIRKVFVLTDAATIAIDASKSDNFRVVLGGNRTLGNPTNLRDGQTFNIRIKQDGTGSRTLAYGSKYKFPSSSVPVLSTAINAGDFLSCQYDATNDTIYAVLNKAFG